MSDEEVKMSSEAQKNFVYTVEGVVVYYREQGSPQKS